MKQKILAINFGLFVIYSSFRAINHESYHQINKNLKIEILFQLWDNLFILNWSRDKIKGHDIIYFYFKFSIWPSLKGVTQN